MNVSIIIPVFNVADYVEACLQSVMEQKRIDNISIECLIVDDCGTDESMVIVEHTLASYQGPIEFHILRRDINGGLSAARNTGIRAARGQYIYFLDSDDTITPYCIVTLWHHVCDHPKVDIVYGRTICTPDSSYEREYFDFNSKDARTFCNNKQKIHEKYLTFPEIACNKLIRTDWLRTHNLYFTEGITHEDLDWHLRSYFYISSYACELNSTPTYLYLQRPGSIMDKSLSDEERRIRCSAEIFIRCYLTAPYWDAPIANDIYTYLFDLQCRAITHPKTFWHDIYHQAITSLKSKKRGLTPLQRMLLRYISLGRPWTRQAILRMSYRFMPNIKS